MNSPDIQGVILIDVWADDQLQDFYHGLVKNTKAYNIRCCVNASYSLDLSAMLNTVDQNLDISMSNTFRLHQYNTLYSTDDNLPTRPGDNRLIMNLIKHSHGKSRTDPILATPNLLLNHASVMAMEIEDFLHHCAMYHNNGIKNWLVAGQAWLMCVHYRPIGLVNLAKLLEQHQMNFYVTPWSVVDKNKKTLTKKHFKDLDPVIWQEVPGFGYRVAGTR